MADPRFFNKAEGKTLEELAQISDCQLLDGANSNKVIDDVSPLDRAEANQISFLDNIKYKESFSHTSAGACIIAEEMIEWAPKNIELLVSQSPYKSYALVAQAFYPREEEEFISPHADISKNAQIGKNCRIGAFTVIGPNVVIGDNCQIADNVTITHSLIGNHVTIYPGVRIGQDGFGFAIDPAGHVKVPQLGRVIIEDHVEIGANTTIDRGAGPDTVIGQGTWIDNLVQIGHNVKIGRGCVIVAQAGIAGSTVLEDYVVMAAQSGVAGHLTIGMAAKLGAKSGAMRNIPPGEEQFGIPAMPVKQAMRQVAALKRLTKGQKTE